MADEQGRIQIRDSTLREGLDTPGVAFSDAQKRRILGALEDAGVPECEVVAPSRVKADLEFVKAFRREGAAVRLTGLVYAYSDDFDAEVEEAERWLDRLDVLVPLSEARRPHGRGEKLKLVSDALRRAAPRAREVGVGFPHSTQAEPGFLFEMVQEAAASGAARVTLYDTNGSAEPFGLCDRIGPLAAGAGVPLFFHGHNDLGLATANALAAVRAGARGLDLTVNGIGDRAGNASLEQVALCLALRGIHTGIALDKLGMLSDLVARESGVPVSKLAPVVGEYVFSHKSPSHLELPALFEAFDPSVTGVERKLTRS